MQFNPHLTLSLRAEAQNSAGVPPRETKGTLEIERKFDLGSYSTDKLDGLMEALETRLEQWVVANPAES